MRLRLRIFTACALVFATQIQGWAQERSPIMGDYEGGFLDDSRRDLPLKIQVIAEGDDRYAAVFWVGPYDGSATRVVAKGQGRRGAATFKGDVDLGADRGGTCSVEAEIFAGTLTGRFTGPKAPGPFNLSRVEKHSPTEGASPPPGAVVLFNGTDIDDFQRRPDALEEGVLRAASASFVSKTQLGSIELHLEFRCPLMPGDRGQARGNSGVYVQGRYEVQVLDTFGLPTRDNHCGGLYGFAAPLVNASFPPRAWQTYDISFRAPQFNDSGEKTRNAMLTVYHNAVLIHDRVEVSEISGGALYEHEGSEGALFLQDHNDRVEFRNIWAVRR